MPWLSPFNHHLLRTERCWLILILHNRNFALWWALWWHVRSKTFDLWAGIFCSRYLAYLLLNFSVLSICWFFVSTKHFSLSERGLHLHRSAFSSWIWLLSLQRCTSNWIRCLFPVLSRYLGFVNLYIVITSYGPITVWGGNMTRVIPLLWRHNFPLSWLVRWIMLVSRWW